MLKRESNGFTRWSVKTKCYTLEELQEALQDDRGARIRFYAIPPKPFDLAHRYLGLDIVVLGGGQYQALLHDHDLDETATPIVSAEEILRMAEEYLNLAEDYRYLAREQELTERNEP